MQDIHHADIGPPIDSVIEFGSFATRPSRRADAGKRIGTMQYPLAIINRNDVKTMSAANYSHHRPMQDIHHADIGPPIDSVIEFGSFATRPSRRADAGKRIGTMQYPISKGTRYWYKINTASS